MLVGAVSGLLPCGALYSAVLIASSAGSAAWGAVSMAAFAAASGVGLLGAGLVSRAARSVGARRVLGLALVLGAVLVVARPLAQVLAPDASPSCGTHAPG
jgi:hypothetical protein